MAGNAVLRSPDHHHARKLTAQMWRAPHAAVAAAVVGASGGALPGVAAAVSEHAAAYAANVGAGAVAGPGAVGVDGVLVRVERQVFLRRCGCCDFWGVGGGAGCLRKGSKASRVTPDSVAF
eukprot:109474-Chlamydomonas_euryale.AAC.1